MPLSRVTISFYCFLALCIAPYAARALTVEITATVPGCGDNIIGVGEQCDGTNLGGATCASLGYVSGTLTCTSVCTQDTSHCSMDRPQSTGGGGGGWVVSTGAVAFSGRAYPDSAVAILKDGQIAGTTVSGRDGVFSTTISGLSTGDYIFGVYALDDMGVQSPILSFPVSVGRGAVMKVSGIAIAPSIYPQAENLKKGDSLVLTGNAIPGLPLMVIFDKGDALSMKVSSDASGKYSAKLDTHTLIPGIHTLRIYSDLGGEMSAYSRVITITIITNGTHAVAPQLDRRACGGADVNCDGRVNLVDFSIMLYWYKNPIPPASVDLNNDGVVNIVDFSILMFHWTA